MPSLFRFPSGRLAVCALACLLVSCGGGGGGSDGATTGSAQGAECTVDAQKAWLGGYMDEWYFWNRLSPRPDAAAYSSVADYFTALRYTGSDPAYPAADRWSGSQSSEVYNRFFGDGQTLGYGLSVAGIEVAGQPDRPLRVRYVEPLSPAAAAGIRRGDEVLSINGRSASSLIAANDFEALTANAAGDGLRLRLRSLEGAERDVAVTAAVHTLTPVAQANVVTSPGGQRLGHVFVKDMISQATGPLEAAFTRLKAEGAQAVVLDLRYNGGGLVSVGRTVASYAAGTRGQGRVYAQLLYNDRRAPGNNSSFVFEAQPQAIDAPRVYVLSGPRTCSASEQVVNGLRGLGIDTVTIGHTSCGKPVGFVPTARCGMTYSVVNFESVNARGQGRYFDGLAASCRVDEDFSQPLGSPSDPLLAAALAHADTGRCPEAAAGVANAAAADATGDAARRQRARGIRDSGGADGVPGMLPR